jgi:hypothetical protein
MDGGYIIERLITAMGMISDIVVHIQTHMGKECVIYYREVKQSQRVGTRSATGTQHIT